MRTFLRVPWRLKLALIVIGLLVVGVLTVWWLRGPSYMESFPPPQPFPMPTPDLARGSCSIEGRVADAKGPIPGSWVSAVSGRRLASARCGADGFFRLDGLPEGSFEITAGAKGYKPGGVTVSAGEGPVTIVLEPLSVFGQGPYPAEAPGEGFKLLSRIVRRGGPASGFSVALLPGDLRTAPGIYQTTVDSEGFFQIENLPAGLYRLLVLSAARAHDLEFCYRSLPVDLGPERIPPPSIEIETMEIQGRVYAEPAPDVLPVPDPLPFEGAAVRLRLLGEGGRSAEAGFVDSGPAGGFRFPNLPIADYEISVLATDFKLLTQRIPKGEDPEVVLRLLLTR